MDDLPIILSSEGLFEADDKASRFLIEKLEAWLNFQALVAHWYEDEAKVVTFGLTLLPERLFLQQQVELDWQPLKAQDLVAVYRYDSAVSHFKVFILLSNAEIDRFMSSPAELEPNLRQKLRLTLNQLAVEVSLPALTD